MEIFRLLEESPAVADFEVLDFRTWEDGFYYKIRIKIRDGSLLFAREFFSQDERHYSFHWQDAQGILLSRWDDAPHHRHLPTFPHHKHFRNQILESSPVNLSLVLEEKTQTLSP